MVTTGTSSGGGVERRTEARTREQFVDAEGLGDVVVLLGVGGHLGRLRLVQLTTR